MSVTNLINIKANNIGAFLKKIAPRNASPIAMFLAEKRPELNDIFIASGPSKKDGFKIAIMGPTNIGQIKRKRQNENNPENSIFLFERLILVFMGKTLNINMLLEKDYG